MYLKKKNLYLQKPPKTPQNNSTYTHKTYHTKTTSHQNQQTKPNQHHHHTNQQPQTKPRSQPSMMDFQNILTGSVTIVSQYHLLLLVYLRQMQLESFLTVTPYKNDISWIKDSIMLIMLYNTHIASRSDALVYAQVDQRVKNTCEDVYLSCRHPEQDLKSKENYNRQSFPFSCGLEIYLSGKDSIALCASWAINSYPRAFWGNADKVRLDGFEDDPRYWAHCSGGGAPHRDWLKELLVIRWQEASTACGAEKRRGRQPQSIRNHRCATNLRVNQQQRLITATNG